MRVKGIKNWYEENGRYFNIDGTEVVSKVCSNCGQEKLLGEFGKNKKGRFGLSSKCKVCVAKYKKNTMIIIKGIYWNTAKNTVKIIKSS